MIVTAGETDKSVYYYIVGDASHASPGDPITGLLYSDIETGGSASYARQGAARVDLTLITLASASAAHSDGGFIQVDATNMPGVYRCDYPDAAWATGVDQTICHLVVASANNAAVAPILVDIFDFDTRSATVDLNADQSGVTIGTVNNVTGLVAGSGGISTAAESFTATVAGSPTNSYTDTRTEDGTHHIVPPSGADTDIYYQFDIGNSGVPQTITWIGYAQSNGDSYAIYGYNYGTTTYEQIGTIAAANGTNQMTGTFDLLTDHVGTGANAGKVRFRALSADGTNFATDRLFCTYTQATSGIPNGSTITLAASATNENFIGNAWNLALGGQTVSGSFVSGAVSISGTGVTANGNPLVIQGSKIDTCTLSAYAIIGRTDLSDVLTVVSTSGGADDEFDLFNCVSGFPGSGSPTINASGVTKTTGLQNRLYGGGITYSINNYCTLSHETIIGGTVTLTNAAGAAEIRGAIKSFVLTSSGAATTNLVVESTGAPITVNGTGGTLNVWGPHGGITDNSGASVTINDLGVDITTTDAAATWDRVLTGATHNITDSAGRRIRNLQEFGGYEDNRVWIDTITGSAGTTNYESGTILNKLDNVADSNTVGTSLGIGGRGIAPGSSVTFAASQDGQDWKGNIWTLALGGQSISDTHIFGADVSGVCTGANPPEFHECIVGNVTVPPCTFRDSDMGGTITLPVGTVHLHHCAGEAGSILDYGAAIANTTVHWTDFSGDLVIDNLGQNGTDILNVRGHGKITFNASCVGGTVNWDGHFTIVNNGSGITFNSDDISTNVDTLLADLNNGGRLDLIFDAVLAMLDDPRGEPGQGAPPVNPDMATKLDYLYKWARNKSDNDGSTINHYDDAGTTVDQKRTVSEAAGTVTKGEMATGP